MTIHHFFQLTVIKIPVIQILSEPIYNKSFTSYEKSDYIYKAQ